MKYDILSGGSADAALAAVHGAGFVVSDAMEPPIDLGMRNSDTIVDQAVLWLRRYLEWQGHWYESSTDAMKAAQRWLGVAETGRLDVATQRGIDRYGITISPITSIVSRGIGTTTVTQPSPIARRWMRKQLAAEILGAIGHPPADWHHPFFPPRDGRSPGDEVMRYFEMPDPAPIQGSGATPLER